MSQVSAITRVIFFLGLLSIGLSRCGVKLPPRADRTQEGSLSHYTGIDQEADESETDAQAKKNEKKTK